MKSNFAAIKSELNNLIGAASNINGVIEFITNGQLVKTLTAVGYAEYSAAIDALRKLPHAQDQRSVIWSAVNHLESAHAIFRPLYRDAGFFREALAGISLNKPMFKDLLTLSLMALCYRYLGERKLMLETLDEAFMALHYSSDIGLHEVLNIVSPLNWLEMLKDEVGLGNPDDYTQYASWFSDFNALMRKE